jgi:hypothetical protein
MHVAPLLPYLSQKVLITEATVNHARKRTRRWL